jgi:hypothetical protein
VTKAKDGRTPEELSEQELEETNGEPLPERQAMTLIRGVEPLPFPIVPDDAAVQIDDPQAT